jgi:hypothetical protein
MNINIKFKTGENRRYTIVSIHFSDEGTATVLHLITPEGCMYHIAMALISELKTIL